MDKCTNVIMKLLLNLQVHQSNYEAGYRLLHITYPVNDPELEEVGFFDVYPESNSANFQGTWSNYPWLKNGQY